MKHYIVSVKLITWVLFTAFSQESAAAKSPYLDSKLYRADYNMMDNCTKYHFRDGELHRTDGPAIECADGYKAYYQSGKLHRTDGPAIEWASHKEWYLDGKLHRTDGPAIEHCDGTYVWYLNGKRLSESDYIAKCTADNISTIAGEVISGIIVIDSDNYYVIRVKQ